MMTHEKKLSFVHKMTQLGLSQIPHYDAGGTVLNGPSGASGSGATNPNTGVLGTINGAVGLNNNFSAGAANTQAGTNAAQLNNAYTGAQEGLTNQTGLVGQTQPGVAQGLGAQSQLSNQLMNQANGVGPNPAQAALNQSTGQNIAQQAALAAGQRGAGGNAGMLAAQNAQQGAATQQNAVGQAATLQAQQQIAAQQQAAGLAAQQVGQGATAIQNQNQQQQNEQNILQGSNTSFNNAQVGMQSNINNVNSQTSAANQNMAANTFGGILSGLSSAQSSGSGAISGIASMFADGGTVGGDTPSFQATPSDASSGPSVAASSPLPADSTSFAQSVSPPQSSGGGGGAGLGALALLAAAHGGTVHKMAQGGYMAPTPLVVGGQGGPQSMVGQWINSQVSPTSGPQIQATGNLAPDNVNLSKAAAGTPAKQPGGPQGDQGANQDPSINSQIEEQEGAEGNIQPASGGLTDMGMLKVAKGGSVRRMLPPMHGKNAQLIARGGKVKAEGKGEKAVDSKDDYANDKIPALLSEGEVVIDKNTLSDPGPLGQAARMVAQHINMRNAAGKGAKKHV